VKMLADLSPEIQAVILPALGFVAKMIADSLIKAFKETISTPQRVTLIENSIKAREEETVILKRDLAKCWEKYEALDKRVAIAEHQLKEDE